MAGKREHSHSRKKATLFAEWNMIRSYSIGSKAWPNKIHSPRDYLFPSFFLCVLNQHSAYTRKKYQAIVFLPPALIAPN